MPTELCRLLLTGTKVAVGHFIVENDLHKVSPTGVVPATAQVP